MSNKLSIPDEKTINKNTQNVNYRLVLEYVGKIKETLAP
jgi:hypothetical protein